jgi:predicted metalloprotease with PDZ domain
MRGLAHGLLRLSCTLLLSLCATSAASAQALDVKIKVVSVSPARVHVEGRRAGGASNWSFRKFYAGVSGLAERVENFSLYDEGGAAVAVNKLAPGEYTAAKPSPRFSYDLKLDTPAFVTDAAHVSWLTADRGLLMPGDLLPLPLAAAKIELILPSGWDVSTVETKNADGTFDAAKAENSVFAVGRDLREKRAHIGGMMTTFAAAGDWSFSDEDAAGSVGEILKIYVETMGGVPHQRSLIVLLPLPLSAAGNLWSAETRGSTVVLLSGRVPSKLAAQAQLDGSLTHELFHLWIPNALALEGEYDWFYEGFTNYMALRAGMRRGQLTFQDYLNTLAREYDTYRSARGAKEISLPEASQRRWSGSTALVYHKGMLVAFLYDLTLMRATNGKASLSDVYRELFRRYGQGGERADGNRAIINALGEMPGVRDFVAQYVESNSEIALASLIESFGLEIEPGGARTHVGVVSSPDRAQRELLRKLGYNEKLDADERKLHERMKKRLPQ